MDKKAPLNLSKVVDEVEMAAAETLDEKVILFATPTCPNCKAAATFLDKAGIPYEKLMANEHADLVEKYGIRQAPTLVTSSGEKIVNLSNIKAYTERK